MFFSIRSFIYTSPLLRLSEAYVLPHSEGKIKTVFHNHIALNPPSTGRPIPVIQLLSSLARNNAAFAMSSGSPNPRNGCCANSNGFNSGLLICACGMAVLVSLSREKKRNVFVSQCCSSRCIFRTLFLFLKDDFWEKGRENG